MNLEVAKSTILALLEEKGRATNSAMSAALGNDRALLDHVREDLILNDLAKDKDGVELIYLAGHPSPAPPASAVEHDPASALEPIDVDQTQVFISYGHADAFDFASRLRGDLVRHGYKAWMDNKTLQGGTNWVIEIEMGIARSSNPFSDTKKAMLIAGSFGFGTWAGVKVATSPMFLNHELVSSGRSVECVVETEVENDTGKF